MVTPPLSNGYPDAVPAADPAAAVKRALRSALRWLVCAACGVVVGLLGSFQQGWRLMLGGVDLPVGAVLGLALTLATVVWAGVVSRSRVGAALTFFGWMSAVLVLAMPRPEGDLIVPGTVAGYVWLFGGTLLGAAAMAWPYGRGRGVT